MFAVVLLLLLLLNLFLIGFLWIWSLSLLLLLLFLLHFWCVFSCVVTVWCFCRFSFCGRLFFPLFCCMCAEVLLFQRRAFWVLGVCVSFWSLLSMIQSRLLWRYGNAFLFPVFSGLWIWVPEIISLCTLRIAKEFVHFENYPLFFWVILGLENLISLSSRFWNSSKGGRSKN